MQETITSLQNPLIKKILRLKKENHRKKDGIVVIEGEKEVEMAKLSNISINTVIVCEEYNFNKNTILEISHEKIFNISKNIFKKVSNRENPDGIIALANIERKKLKEIEISEKMMVLAVENIEKPGNLGAIIRSVDAVGADAVLVLETSLDIYNPNVIRSSRGSVFSVPVISASLKDFFDWTSYNSIISYAATPHESSLYTEQNFQEKCVFLLGNEHDGLSDEALKMANYRTKIPMNGKIDSLNVSVSSAVLLYEALRQRQL